MKTIAQVITILSIIALASCSLQDLINAMTPSGSSPGCISFSPYVDPYTPNYGPAPPVSLIRTLMTNLVQQSGFRCIHIYNLGATTYGNILMVARELNVKVLANIYFDAQSLSIDSLPGAISNANNYRDTLLGISCGSETIYESNNPNGVRDTVASCVRQLRNGGVTQPIGYIDVFTGWCGGDEYPCNNFFGDLAAQVDFVGLDEFPWWLNTYSRMFPCQPASNAANQTIFRFNALQAKTSKPVILTEYGWPGARSGQDIVSTANVYNGQQCGIANLNNQKTVNQQIVNICAANRLPCCLFSANNEEWKGNGNPNDVNNFWGICSGESPYNCFNVPTAPGSVSAPNPSGCPSGWTKYNNYCYRVFTNSLSYTNARQSCRSQGGYLASITTWQLNSWINSFVSSSVAEFWIGGARSSSSAAFKWDDSRTWAYKNFDANQPNSWGNYVSFIHGTQFGTPGKWRTITNAYTKPFLCHRLSQ